MTGVLPLLKPPGMSSQEAVSRVRRLTGVRRCGHAGTLDPEAGGVLPVMLGRATKLSDYLMHAPKEYIAELRTGLATDTLDSEGRIVLTSPKRFSASDLQQILPRFTGRIEQLTPRYAAVKKDGRPLYAYARAGMAVEQPRRTVQVDSLELLSQTGDRFLLRIACRQGTYIRSLLNDMAAALGTAGYTSYLLRTSAGFFSLSQTYSLEELERSDPQALLTPPGAAVHLEKVTLPDYLYRILASGAAIEVDRVPGCTAQAGQDYAVWCRQTFFGIGTVRERGLVLTARIAGPEG